MSPKSETASDQTSLAEVNRREVASIGRLPRYARLGDYAAREIRVLVTSNPKQVNSKSRARFDLYRDGMTVEEYLAAGGIWPDIRWDLERGFIELV